MYLSLDGHVGHPLPRGAEVVVAKSDLQTHPVRCSTSSYFDRLRVKLGWGNGA